MAVDYRVFNKTITFSENNTSEMELLKAIENNTENFSRDTKKMWANHLKVKFEPIGKGKPKVGK